MAVHLWRVRYECVEHPRGIAHVQLSKDHHAHQFMRPGGGRPWHTGRMALHITGDTAADELLSDNPLALLIGMLLDQRVR